MNHFRKCLLSFIFIVAPLFVGTQIQAAVQLDITAPSDAVVGENYSKIASGRSFYVMGNIIEGTDIPENATFLVQVYKGNEVVRESKTTVQANSNLDAAFSGLNFYSPVTAADIVKSGMPDLIWDGTEAKSFYNGDAKCYYNDTKFAALICGGTGAIDEGMNWKDANGNAYKALEGGVYDIKVSVKKEDDSVLATAEKTIEIGASANKVMSRFSDVNGNGHFERVKKFATENHYRIYLDAFPGYWSQEVFAEILPEWRAADATEYNAGKVHFLIYNVKASSATYSVELAQLERMGDVDDASRLVNYYYTYGEPTVNDKESSISEFAAGDKLQFTRADIETTGDKTEENVYHVNQKADATDYCVSDGVSARCGEKVSLFGVTAPIQLSDADIADNGNNAYSLNNQIATLKYTITGDGVKEEVSKDVSLNRVVEDWNNPSQLEFKHDFTIPASWAGKTLTVTVKGYDKHTAEVAGTAETVTLHVASTATPSPLPTASAMPKGTATPSPTQAPTKNTAPSAPKRVTVKKVTSIKKKTITITWKKCTGAGYQIYIATNKKFTKNMKSFTLTSSKTLKKTIRKLKTKKYYVKVRAYKRYNKKKVYGKWSQIKIVKVKK